jgi:hypothetical protein
MAWIEFTDADATLPRYHIAFIEMNGLAGTLSKLDIVSSRPYTSRKKIKDLFYRLSGFTLWPLYLLWSDHLDKKLKKYSEIYARVALFAPRSHLNDHFKSFFVHPIIRPNLVYTSIQES